MSDRSQDLLQTAVVVGIALTPVWLTPSWFGGPWGALVLLGGIPALWLSWKFAPFVPTPPSERQRVLQASGLGAGMVFCDLGAGDGRMVLDAANTGADAFGVEANPWLVVLGKLRLRGRGRMLWGDLYKTDLSGVDVVFVWGTSYSAGTQEFASWLASSVKPGALVVSYSTELARLDGERHTGGQRDLWLYRF